MKRFLTALIVAVMLVGGCGSPTEPVVPPEFPPNWPQSEYDYPYVYEYSRYLDFQTLEGFSADEVEEHNSWVHIYHIVTPYGWEYYVQKCVDGVLHSPSEFEFNELIWMSFTDEDGFKWVCNFYISDSWKWVISQPEIYNPEPGEDF